MSNPLLVQYLAAALFAIGLVVVVSRRNLFFILMGIELLLNAVGLSFVGFSRLVPEASAVDGQLAVVVLIAVAAAEACIALAMVVVLVRGQDSLDVDTYAVMKE